MKISLHRSTDQIAFTIKAIKIILFISSVGQLLFFFNPPIVFVAISSFLGVYILEKYLLTSINIIQYPISTISISLYALFFIIMPMPATLLEMKPVTYNLRLPYFTFFNVLLLFVVLVVTFNLYKRIVRGDNKLSRLLYRTPLFEKLTVSELWVLVTASLIIYIAIIYKYGFYDQNNINAISKIPLYLYYPFKLFEKYYIIIPILFYPKLGVVKKYDLKRHIIPIIITILTTMAIGVTTNMRTKVIIPLAFLFFALIFYWFFSLSYHTVNWRKVLLVVIPFFFVFYAFNFLSKAMTDARGARRGLSADEMIHETIERIKHPYESASLLKIEWNENYLDNAVLNRFCSVKVLDETLYFANKRGYYRKDLQNHFINTLYNQWPLFIRDLFSIEVINNKATYADILYDPLSEDNSRIGTLQGVGLGLFGWWWLIVIIPIYFIIFYLMDSVVFLKGGSINLSWLFIYFLCDFCYWFSDKQFYDFEIFFIMRHFWSTLAYVLLSITIVRNLPLINHS